MSSGAPSANDKYSLAQLPQDILRALDFWAQATPLEPALKAPRGQTAADGIEIVTFAEWKAVRDLIASRLAFLLDLGAPGCLGEPYRPHTITFLISPTHEVINPWIAMSSLGYTVQFISHAHQPSIVARLIRESRSHVVLHCNMDPTWLDEVKLTTTKCITPPEFVELPHDHCLASLLSQIRDPNYKYPDPFVPIMHVIKPDPSVYLHSFGSTARPKLYPISLLAANMSAKDASFWCHQQPAERRWRCQLQTSLPFHFSFQNPIWRSLMCGTTCAFPLLDSSITLHGIQRLVPDATDILESLCLTGADIVYASPNGLQAMLEKAASPDSKGRWRDAVRNLKEAHTGAAPVSNEKAECFERHGLSVLQVFALTEAGLLFHARKEHTGHTTWLKPLIRQKPYMLFRQTEDLGVYELWLREDFPGLRRHSVIVQPYPDDPKIKAWNTCDTFRKLPRHGEGLHDDLVTFAGRQDDWLRCTHGTAVRALEMEDYLLETLREALGYDRVQALTVIGHGRSALGAVVQFNEPSVRPTFEESRAFENAARYVNGKLLQHPAVLDPHHLVRTDEENPIRVTLKGSILRKENEAIFGPALDKLMGIM